MRSFDYDAMVYDGDIYCVGCLPDGVTVRDADPIFADSEWDYAPVCAHCETEHDYMTLTGTRDETGPQNEAEEN